MKLLKAVWIILGVILAWGLAEVLVVAHLHNAKPAPVVVKELVTTTASTPGATAAIIGDAADDSMDCTDMLDSLSPTEAADCVQPTVRKVIVFLEEMPNEDDGHVQLLIFVGHRGEIVTYNRAEFLGSPWLQVLLKRLTAAKHVEKQWFAPFAPVDGSCI